MPLKRLEREKEWEEASRWAEKVDYGSERKKTKKIPFSFQMEEDIYYRLKNYVNKKAKRYESMAYLLNRAIEKYLDELEKRSE